MPKKPNPKHGREGCDDAATQTWEDDQLRREYYYDDAHGYQQYDPEAEDEDVIEDEKKPGLETDPAQ